MATVQRSRRGLLCRVHARDDHVVPLASPPSSLSWPHADHEDDPAPCINRACPTRRRDPSQHGSCSAALNCCTVYLHACAVHCTLKALELVSPSCTPCRAPPQHISPEVAVMTDPRSQNTTLYLQNSSHFLTCCCNCQAQTAAYCTVTRQLATLRAPSSLPTGCGSYHAGIYLSDAPTPRWSGD